MNNKVWVVMDPTIGCSLSELMYETTAVEFARQVAGGGLADVERRRPRFHVAEEGAVTDVRGRIEAAAGNLTALIGPPLRKTDWVHTGAVRPMFDHLVSSLSSQPPDFAIGVLNTFMTADLSSALNLKENGPYLKLISKLHSEVSRLDPEVKP